MASSSNRLASENVQQKIREKSTSENVQLLSDQESSINRNKDLSKLSAIKKYKEEWNELVNLSRDTYLQRLRARAINGELKASKFRSVCWALLMGVLSGDSSSWTHQRQSYRKRYVELIRQFHTNPRMTSQDDPLSQSEDSIWNQHFCDKELCTVIKQDVIRTFPGVEFFRKTFIEDIMTNVLFCYARSNPEMCYRQGMHEILAPILFIMHSDQQSFLHIKDLANGDIDNVLKEVLNPKYLEEDSYFIFSKIMTEIEPFYRIHDLQPTSSGYFPTPVSVNNSPSNNKSISELEVVKTLNEIRDKILVKADSELNDRLLEMDISLPLFGIRWLRLLFGREFQLLDLLYLWDVMFAVDAHLKLTSYILVAMLVNIREDLLNNDYSTCLSYLMKYPSNIDVTTIIRYALHLYAPDKFDRPPNNLSLLCSTKERSIKNPSENYQKNRALILNQKCATLPRNMHSQVTTRNQQQNILLNKGLDNNRLNISTQQLEANKNDVIRDGSRIRSMKGSISEKNRNEILQERVNNLQNATAKAAIRVAKTQQLNHDPSVIDGFLENSPEVLKLQLQNAHTVISITRVKLLQYLAVFRRNIPGNSLHELHQAMDGIEELCELLNIRCAAPYNLPLPVESALEANEGASNSSRIQRQRSQSNAMSPKMMKIPFDSIPPIQISSTTPPRKNQVGDAEAKRQFVRNLKSDYRDMELARQSMHSTELIENCTNLNDKTAIVSTNSHSSVRYEIPDNQISRTAAKILASRKELEMHEFMGIKKSDNISVDVLRSEDNKIPTVDPSGDRQSPS